MKKPIFSPDYSYRYVTDSARQKGIKPQELCRACNISTQSLYQWRTGLSGMTAATKKKIDDYMTPKASPAMIVLVQPWDKRFMWNMQ